MCNQTECFHVEWCRHNAPNSMEADITAWDIWPTNKLFFPQFNNFSAWKKKKNLFCSPSMQCALHQLGGDGVVDWASGHRQGHLWDADSRVPTYCHRCALQGVFARHHTDRQPEKVSPHGSKWENEPVLAGPGLILHIALSTSVDVTKLGSIKICWRV